MPKAEKTLDARVEEAVQIRRKLDDVGVDAASEPGVKRVHAVLNDFVRGHGFTGRVPLPAVGRVALLRLSMQAHVPSVAVLRSVTTPRSSAPPA